VYICICATYTEPLNQELFKTDESGCELDSNYNYETQVNTKTREEALSNTSSQIMEEF
jgi:hypothetical protein